MKKPVLITAAVSAAAAAISSFATAEYVSRKAQKRYERLENDYLKMGEDYIQTMKGVSEYLDERDSFDPDDYIFEEDNEDD